MTTQGAIPIVVGVTGHRDIRDEDRDILRKAVYRELSALRDRCPHSRIVMLNSLAQGADQLCAEAAQALDIPLIAVLPMAREAYEHDFSGDGLSQFQSLCDAAEECFAAPSAERVPEAPDRDFAYRQAGIYVATHSHVLLALWDGTETPASDCGTAAAVRFALDCAYCPADGIPLRRTGAVLHIRTPRGAASSEDAGEVRFLGDRAAFEKTLARTDEFNRLSAESPLPESGLLPEKREADERLDRIETLYAKADALSVRFARQYRRILAALALISTVITVAFLLYDEAELHWMILLCGIMLLLAWLVQRYGKRTVCHRRYLEYRMLAEGLRVQAYLRYAGRKMSVADILPWSEQAETGWVAAALQALCIGAASYGSHSIREPWVMQQYRYHRQSVKKTERAFKGSDRVVTAALLFSILLYLAAVVFELFWGGLLPSFGYISDAERYRTIAKLLLGGISAATLFISNYYGRLSLSRVAADHRKMERFYAVILDRIDRYGETDELLALLAREELIENGNWFSYQQDNTADFSL